MLNARKVFFLLDILFIYILNVIPFPGYPSRKPTSHPPSTCFYEGDPPTTYPPLPPHPGIPLPLGIEPSRDQGLMPDKAILCYICCWNHGSLHVYSLVSGLVLGSSGGAVWLVDIVVLPMELQTPSAPSVLSQLLHWGPRAQSNGWLQTFTSVLVRLWQGLSGDSHRRLLSGSASWHQQ